MNLDFLGPQGQPGPVDFRCLGSCWVLTLGIFSKEAPEVLFFLWYRGKATLDSMLGV